MCFTFLPTGMIYASPHVVFVNEQNSFFCILQSRVHEIWARFLGSSMKDDLRYAPSDCFETFPFPENWETNPTLEAAGKTYYE
ncbi:MAG: type IIL restriction-modification enzyme MmeI, partial [Nostoc sp.]